MNEFDVVIDALLDNRLADALAYRDRLLYPKWTDANDCAAQYWERMEKEKC